jgi:hypothetical protein
MWHQHTLSCFAFCQTPFHPFLATHAGFAEFAAVAAEESGSGCGSGGGGESGEASGGSDGSIHGRGAAAAASAAAADIKLESPIDVAALPDGRFVVTVRACMHEAGVCVYA